LPRRLVRLHPPSPLVSRDDQAVFTLLFLLLQILYLLLQTVKVVKVGDSDRGIVGGDVVKQFDEFESSRGVACLAGSLNEENEFFIDGLFSSGDVVRCEVVVESVEASLYIEKVPFDPDACLVR
jgi:hypothetical protein